MTNYCILNGVISKLERAKLPATDRGFMLGDGIFETLKVYNSKPVWLSEHYKRMKKSAIFSGIDLLSLNEIKRQCESLIGKNKITNGYLRITVSRGSTETGSLNEVPNTPNILINGNNRVVSQTPVKAGFLPWPVNERDPSVRHKTTSRFSYVKGLQLAKEEQLDDLVLVNTKGEITESLIANIFFVKDSVLYTPALDCGLLPGIVREKVLKTAYKLGIYVDEGSYTKKHLLTADEIFFTNSTGLVTRCEELDVIPFDESGITDIIHTAISKLIKKLK